MTGPALSPADGSAPLPHRSIRSRSGRARRRTPMPWLMLAGAVAVISLLAAIYAEGRTALFVGSCWLLACLCMGFVTLYRPDDNLAPGKIVSLLYAACFAIAPLWLADLRVHWSSYFGADREHLMGVTAFLALIGYLCFLVGHFAGIKLSLVPAPRSRLESFSLTSAQRRYAILCATILGMIGAICYFKLLLGAGGLSQLLGNRSEGRADLFTGVYGGWFWGMHLLFCAYGLMAIVFMQRRPWLCLIFAAALGASFIPFQGRDIIVAPIFCWLVFFHVLHKPVKWRLVLLCGVVLIMLSAMVGVLRSSGDGFGKGSQTLLAAFSDNIARHLTNVVAQNIEQLDAAMIAVRYVETEHHTIGPMVLTSWMEPIDRAVLGDVIPSIYTGVFMDLLVIPEHRGWNTALSPSLPGELYIGLGWPGIVFGMAMYGLLFGRLMRWYEKRNRWPLLFAAYPFVTYMLAKMVVDGSTHLFRPMIVLLAVLACAMLTPARGKMRTRITKPDD